MHRAVVPIVPAVLAVTALILTPLAPATAEPTLLPPTTAFTGTATSSAVVELAGDGTLVVGRIAPTSNGAVEVQVRRPGGSLGAVTTLQAAQPGVSPYGLTLVGGPDGTLAAYWNDGSGFSLRTLPAGSSTWTSARDVDLLAGSTTVAVDAKGRAWIAGQQTGSPFGVAVAVYGRTGAPVETEVTSTFNAFPPPQVTGLTIGRDGRARIVAAATQLTGSFLEAQPCGTRTTLLVADIAAGADAATWTTLESRESSGIITAAICNDSSGSRLTSPRVVTTRNGTTLITYTVTAAGTTQSSLREFVQRPGQPWADLSTEALAAGDGRSFTALVPAGDRAVVEVAVNGLPLTHHLLVRSPSGSWSPLKAIPGTDAVTQVSVDGSTSGYAVLAWPAGTTLRAHLVLPTGKLGPALPTTSTPSDGLFGVATDGEGNAVLLQRFDDSGTQQARAMPVDVAGPRLTRALPAKAKVDKQVTLKATSVDVWSTLKQATWRIDGGKPRTGTTIKVAFSSAGKHRVVLTLLDKAGNASTTRHVVTVTR